VIDGFELSAMVAGRRAASRGLPYKGVSLAALGLLEHADAAPSDERPAFESHHSLCPIESLRSDVPVRAGQTTKSWLENHVEDLEVTKWR